MCCIVLGLVYFWFVWVVFILCYDYCFFGNFGCVGFFDL